MSGYFGFNTPNILPQQQIIQVNGKSSVDMIQMAPNSSVLLMDTTAPIVWMCVTDGVGRVSAIPYDVKVHEEEKPVNPLSEIESRLNNLENLIKELTTNEQSNAQKSTSKQHESKPKSNQKHDEYGEVS